jgi:hypothetical protein
VRLTLGSGRCLHRLLARVDAEIWVHATGQSNQQSVYPVVPVKSRFSYRAKTFEARNIGARPMAD